MSLEVSQQFIDERSTTIKHIRSIRARGPLFEAYRRIWLYSNSIITRQL